MAVPAPADPVTALVLNLGSSSLKASSYAFARAAGAAPQARETGRTATTHADAGTGSHQSLTERARALLNEAVAELPALGATPAVVAHRIVHGGERTGPALLSESTVAELQALATLAPLHQPPALALVQAARERWPAARQVGVFDTSWHQTMPARHRLLPLPHDLHARGVRRYGFHGLAFQSAMRQLGQLAPARANGRVVLAHLGGGSSLCAVAGGRSVNTTMGMTPLGGVPMATRCGSLDPGVLLHLQRELGMPPERIDALLWQHSGLRGLSGESGDMRALLASDSPGARRAIEVYVAAIAQAVAAMAACVHGIDLLAFSGGVGRHAGEIRAQVVDELGWLGATIDPASDPPRDPAGSARISPASAQVEVWVLAVDEAAEIAAAIGEHLAAVARE